MKQKNKFLFGIIAITLIVGISIWKYYHTPEIRNEIKIGIILPLTGPGAIYGNDIKKGIELAYNESPLKNQIKLLYQDDAADVTKGINAYNQLKYKNVSIIIGGIMSSVANALMPLANKDKIILFSPKATTPKLSIENDYFFRIWPIDNLDGKFSAQYITDSLKLKKIAIFYSNSEYGIGIKNIFIENLNNKKSTVVFDEGFENGQTDFKSQILKIKNTNPDVVFIPAYLKEIVQILKQANELNCVFYISGVSSFFDNEVKVASGGLVNKIFFTYPEYSTNSNNPVTKIFVDRFKNEYKGQAPNAFSAHGYDSYKIIETNLQSLIKKQQKITSDNIKLSFENMDLFNGATGNFKFNKYGDANKKLQTIWLKNI